MAREKAERGETLSSVSSKKRKAMGTAKNSTKDDDFGGRMGDIGGNEPPEPEVLLSILHKKSKK